MAPAYADKVTVETLTLDWIDLIPENERKQFTAGGMPVADHNTDVVRQSKVGSVRPELNGSKVKIQALLSP